MILEQRALEVALQIVQGAAAKRSPIPALSTIKLEGQNDTLKLSATDLEIMIETRLTAKDGSDFKALLPREQLVELISGLPAGEVRLTPAPGKIEVAWAGGEVVMNAINPEELQSLPIPAADKGITAIIDSSVLRRILGQVSVAVGPNPGRPQLEGCAFEFSGNRLRLVGTDGFRVSIVVAGVENSGAGQFVLPIKTVRQLLRLLPEMQVVKATFGEKIAVFHFEETLVVSVLLGGQYPDVNRVIPKSYVARVTVETDALAGAVKRVALFSEGDLKPVTVAVNGGIILSARSELGQAKEEIPATVEGQVGDIIFTSNFLLQGLTAMESEKVSIEFTGPLTPAKIRPAADGEEQVLYVLLPIRPPTAAGKEAAGG